MGTFPRADRMALMQLILGVQLADAKRLHKMWERWWKVDYPMIPPSCKRSMLSIAEVIKPKPGRGSFDALQDLLFGLIEQGYATKFDLNIFIKSQVTIAGELVELDPNLKQDDLVTKQVTALVKKELFPKRLFCMVFCYNSRNYTSMLSNGDVMAVSHYKKPKEASAPPPKTTSTGKVQTQP